MSYTPTALLHVYYNNHAGKALVGRLAVTDRRILFEYDVDFLKTGIELSPFQVPLKAGVQICDDMLFDGLFGVFNDSLPDGWGRLLLDRTVEKHGINRRQLTALDRLAYVGSNGMGALSYEPDQTAHKEDGEVLQLDKIAEDAKIVLEGDNEEVFEELLRLNGSSAGARPKIVAQVSADKRKIIHGSNKLQNGYEHWMIKFASSSDPKDIGPIEYAYSLMAAKAGIKMPETHLFEDKKNSYFGVKRFDRDGDKRIHMHSLCGLLHADHQSPTLDYQAVLRATHVLTKNMQEVEKAYRLACFNLFAHNRDDHSKNFSYILDDKNEWKLSPAYDLTFSYGPSGEHSTTFMGEGKNPTKEHLSALAKQAGIKDKMANEIINEVHKAILDWPIFAKTCGVSVKSMNEIKEKLTT